MPISGVGLDHFSISQLDQPSEVSGRYVCIISKKLPADYLYVAIEAAIDRFLRRYLQTINISFNDVGKMIIQVHTDPNDQRLIASCHRELNRRIEMAEQKIVEKKRLKENLLGRMMV